jgi:hypothetical protein
VNVDCHVRKLALRAGSREAVESFARNLETALRLVSLPGGRAGEVILIRRLVLDGLPQNASVHALADQIGRRLAEIRPIRLSVGDPERPGAPAVVFAGRLEALAALAAQLARHGAGRAWYWRRLLPPLASSARLADIAECLLVEARAPPHGTAGVAGFVRLLLDAGALDAFVFALPPRAVARPDDPRRAKPALAPAPDEPPGDRPLSGPADLADDHEQAGPWWRALPATWRAAIARQAALLPEDDSRLPWLAATALAATFGPAATARPAALARGLVRLARRDGRPVVAPPRSAIVAAREPDAPTGTPEPARAADHRAPQHVSALPDASGNATSEPTPAGGQVSAWAGLWLLPSALAKLGIADVVSPHGAGLGAACMRALGARLGVPDDDPALVALPQPSPEPVGDTPFLAVPAWRPLAAPHARASPAFALRRAGRYRLLTDGAGRLTFACTAERRGVRRRAGGSSVRRRPDTAAPPPDLAIRAVHLALAKYVRRSAGLGLRRLVHRRGLVVATATHVDVTFPGDVIELPLRRAGLDLDPGWVPWLGRVVAYHYDLERRLFR